MPNWKSESSALKKVKPSPSSIAGAVTLNYLVSQMIYQKIIWRKLILTFAMIPMRKSSQKTLRDVIIYQFLDIVPRDSNKRVIVKFVNRKHPETMLRNKRSISNKDFFHLNVHGMVFVSVSLCFCFWVTERCNAKKIFHVIYLILILMMHEKFKLDFVL